MTESDTKGHRSGIRPVSFYSEANTIHYSFFVIHFSLTETLGEDACQKPLRGVYCEYWESIANRPRRESPAGAPRLTNGGKYDKMFDGMQTKGGSAVRFRTSAAEGSL